MPNGFFLGGMAEGMSDYEKRQLDRDRLSADVGIRTRGLDITERGQNADIGLRERAQTLAEKNAARTANRESMSIADKHIADTMSVVAETVKSGVAAGRDPAIIQKAVAPLLDSAKRLAARAGRDPSVFDAQVGAMLTAPNAIETGTMEGAASGAKKVAERKAIAAAGGDPLGDFKGPKEKADAENSLRDDYIKNSAAFVTIRDAKNRLDSIEETGAGDIALLFQFMKILDPGSTVREGEFATAGSVAGVPGQIEALRKQVVGGGRLADSARAQIKSQANKIYQAQGIQHDKLTTQFSNIAKRQGLNPNNVTVDLTPDAAPVEGVTPFGTRFRIKGR